MTGGRRAVTVGTIMLLSIYAGRPDILITYTPSGEYTSGEYTSVRSLCEEHRRVKADADGLAYRPSYA